MSVVCVTLIALDHTRMGKIEYLRDIFVGRRLEKRHLTMWNPMTTLGMKVTSVMTIISRFTLRSRTLSMNAFFSYFRKRTMA